MGLVVLLTIPAGGYINPFKVLGVLIVLLIWTRLLTWVDKDAPAAHLPRQVLNSALIGGLFVGFLCFLLLPGFGFAFTIFLLCFFTDIGVYLGIRAKVVGLRDLSEQLKQWWQGLFASKAPKEVVVEAGQVLLMDKNGVARPVPGAESPDVLRYQAAQLLLTVPLQYGAERVDLVPGEPAQITYTVDGVRYEGDPMDRNQASQAVQYLKSLAGLDVEERRKPQTGIFKTNLDKHRKTIQIRTLGSTAGETLRLISEPQAQLGIKLDNLGFADDQLKELRELIAGGGGVVIFSAPRHQGLTSLAYGILRSHDAFLNHVHSVERAPELELEGVTQNTLSASPTQGDEAKSVSWIVSQEPDVVMVPLLEDPQSAVELAKFASDTRRVYVGFLAGSTFDALRQWRKLVGDDVLAMRSLKLVISGRLLRRLCTACKVGYAPDPSQLKKLNMNPEAVGKLFLARKEPMRDAKGRPVPCTFCHDLGFQGRFGVYETFTIDDEVRRMIESGGTEVQLKQVFRKQHGRLLQERALLHVQAGDTSLEEVLRVLKGDGTTPSPSSPMPTLGASSASSASSSGTKSSTATKTSAGTKASSSAAGHSKMPGTTKSSSASGAPVRRPTAGGSA